MIPVRLAATLLLALLLLLPALPAAATAPSGADPASAADDRPAAAAREPSFYPGYGAADPDYHYRKGKELTVELVKAEWVIHRLTIFAKEKRKMVVSNDLLAMLRQQMPDLKAGRPFPAQLSAQIVTAVQVEFTANVTLFFRSEVKMGRHKVWFELFRAKRTFWPWLEWEPCGKTYEFHDWPVSDEVGTEFRVLP